MFEREDAVQAEFKRDFPFLKCDLCVGEDWHPILRVLCYHIRHHTGRWNEVVAIREKFLSKGVEPLPWIVEYFEQNPTNPFVDFKVVQVKAKFGTLRFYVESSDDYINGLIAMAESLAHRVVFLPKEGVIE